MESAKQKVMVKPSTNVAIGPISSGSLAPSVVSGQPVVIRAKVSGSARTKTQTSTVTSVSVNGTPKSGSTRSTLTPNSGVRSPSPTKFTVRSPSPSKFIRPGSPVKSLQQTKSTEIRNPASISKAALRSARVDKTTGSIATVFDDSLTTFSAPSLRPQNGGNADDTSSKVSKASTNSLRIKAKVTTLTKPSPQTVPTIVSPPSPPFKTSSIPSPVLSGRPRVRAMTTIKRPASVDDSRLIPLPTSPPTSTLSFSSHSSTSISSFPSHPASDVDTLSTTRSGLPSKNHSANIGLSSSETKASNELKHPIPSTRSLVARVRADTWISEGSGRTSRRSPPEDNGELEENDVLSGDDGLLPTRRKTWRSPSQEREDEERAEAKSNRKIADLEITTKSLLSINASLETTKARQASEIRELRRKLRQARLALPHKRYKLLLEEDGAENANENDDDESTDVEENEETDECFLRIKHIIDELLTVGRNALATPAPSFGSNSFGNVLTNHVEGEVLTWDASGGSSEHGQRDWKHVVAIGSRVLTADEVKKWTDAAEGSEDEDGPNDDPSHTNTLEEEEVERQIKSEPSNQHILTEDSDHEDTKDDNDVPSSLS